MTRIFLPVCVQIRYTYLSSNSVNRVTSADRAQNTCEFFGRREVCPMYSNSGSKNQSNTMNYIKYAAGLFLP